MSERINNGWFSENVGPRGPPGLKWRGSWIVTETYRKDDLVNFQGAIYFASTTNKGKQPGSSSSSSVSFWQIFMQGFKWRGIWSVGINYYYDDVVEYNGSTYIAIENSTGIVPNINPNQWNLMCGSSEGSSSYTGGTNITIASDNSINLIPNIVVDTITMNGVSTTSNLIPGSITLEQTSIDQSTHIETDYTNFSGPGISGISRNLSSIFLDVTNDPPRMKYFIDSATDSISQIINNPASEGASPEFWINYTKYNGSTEGTIVQDTPIFQLREKSYAPRLTVPGLADYGTSFPYTRVLVADDAGNIVSYDKNEFSNISSGFPAAQADGQLLISNGATTGYVPVTATGGNGIIITSSGSAMSPSFVISADTTASTVLGGITLDSSTNNINLTNDPGYAFTRTAAITDSANLWNFTCEPNSVYTVDTKSLGKTFDTGGNILGVYLITEAFIVVTTNGVTSVTSLYSQSGPIENSEQAAITPAVSGNVVSFNTNIPGSWSSKIDIVRV